MKLYINIHIYIYIYMGAHTYIYIYDTGRLYDIFYSTGQNLCFACCCSGYTLDYHVVPMLVLQGVKKLGPALMPRNCKTTGCTQQCFDAWVFVIPERVASRR